MIKYIFYRLLGMIPTLFVIMTVSFFVVRLAPGSPFVAEKGIPQEILVQLKAKYGLDKPLLAQYFNYLGRVAQGDLGPSIRYEDRSVNEIIWEGLPNTVALGLIALAWALLLGIFAGVIAAVYRGRWIDNLAMTVAMLGICIPMFVLGPLLILFFSIYLKILPPARFDSISSMILPGITLGTIYAAYISRLTRAGVLEVIGADYIRTARAKGMPSHIVLFRHTLRGGLMPVITFLGPAVASLLTGSIVVERIFAIPGIGPYFVDAAINRDYFLVMGIVLLYSVLLLIMNMMVDIVYGLLDPRIRYDAGT